MASLGNRILIKSLQRYWRLTRSLTMGAQGIVLDEQGRVLLIRPTYKAGWHFPGGGVERNETVRTALERELEEEAGVILEGEPELFSIYANFRAFPCDHVALFLVRQWRRPKVPPPNREIITSNLFHTDALPTDTIGAVRRRLAEVLEGKRPDESW